MSWNKTGKGKPSPFVKTTEIIIREIQLAHGNNLLYDRVSYINSNTKITVGCRIHGYFEKWPNDLKKGSGCPRCNNSFYKTHEEFLEEIKVKYPEYKVLDLYKNAKTKLNFLCLIHNNIFFIAPNTLLLGHTGCKKCSLKKQIETSVKNGIISDPTLKSEFERYKSEVWRFSNSAYKKYMIEQKRDRQNHLDHILSILDGFKNNVPAEIVGSKYNLRIISGHSNRKKSYKSDISVDELLKKFKENK